MLRLDDYTPVNSQIGMENPPNFDGKVERWGSSMANFVNFPGSCAPPKFNMEARKNALEHRKTKTSDPTLFMAVSMAPSFHG